jgi:hypothetical protein
MNSDEILEKVLEQTENSGDSFSRDELKSGGDFTKRVRKIIRREFRKAGIVLLAILLAVLCFVQWGLSPIVAAFYYNPMVQLPYATDKQFHDDVINLDVAVYTELRNPLDIRDYVLTYNRGYGRYDVVMNGYSNEDYRYGTITGHIDRGNLFLYNRESLRMQHSGSLLQYVSPEAAGAEYDEEKGLYKSFDEEKGEYFYFQIMDHRAYFTEKISKLPDDNWGRYVIHLKDPMSIEETENFKSKFLFSESWQGVVTGSIGSNAFGYTWTGNVSYPSYLDYNKVKYPHLVTGEKAEGGGDIQTVEDVETHFISMLKYMADRKQFVNMVDDVRDRDSYSLALEYIKENGIKIYCIVTWASAKEILEVYNDPAVEYIAELD